MATGVQILKSTDASAPTLSGTAGDLTTVLDAVLVNGYGSKSALGVGGAGAWSIDKTGTNKRVYRPSAGNRFGLRVRDNAGGTGGAQEALLRGADAWTDVDTPVANDTTHAGPFPTSTQITLTDNSLVCRKSNTASSTLRPWIAYGDDRTLYFLTLSGDTVGWYTSVMFGDFYSQLLGDPYRTLLVGRHTENSAAMTTYENLPNLTSTLSGTMLGHYIARSHLGTGLPITCGKHTDYVKSGAAQIIGLPQSGVLANPNAADAGIWLTPVYLHDNVTSSVNTIRGRLRGVWNLCNNPTTFNDGDTFSGTGPMFGKTFLVVKYVGTGGLLVLETSDTLDTST